MKKFKIYSCAFKVVIPCLLLSLFLGGCGRGSKKSKKNEPVVPVTTEGSIYGKLKVDSGDITQARIELKQNERNIKPMKNAEPNGEYEFDNLKSGLYTVEATMVNKNSVTHDVFLDPGEREEIPLLQLLSAVIVPNTSTLEGSINLPPTRADITTARVALLQGSITRANVNPNNRGGYIFTNVAPGTYIIQVSLAGFERGVSSPITVTTRGRMTIPVIDLAPTTGTVMGNIILPAGSAADPRNATVVLLQGSTETARGNPDAGGSYRFPDVPPNTYTIQVSLTGFNNASSSSFNVTARNIATVANITLVPNAGTVAGRIILPAGTTASVTDVAVALLQGSTRTATVKPNSSGNYSFPNVRPGAYTVQTSLTGFNNASSSSITVTAGVTTTIPAITLTRIPLKGNVTGRINVLSSGDPTTATIKLILTSDGSINKTTNPANSGSYSFANVTPDSYLVEVSYPGVTPLRTTSFRVTGGRTSTVITLTITPPAPPTPGVTPTPTTGQVGGSINVLSGGNPATATIRLIRTSDGSVYGTTRPGNDGSYSFDSVPPGEYRVEVIYPMTAPVNAGTITVTISATAMPSTVDVTPGSGISGEVKGSVKIVGSGNPTRAKVALIDDEGSPQANMAPANDGSYEFDNVLPGDYTIDVSYPNTGINSAAEFTVRVDQITTVPEIEVTPGTGLVSDVSGQINVPTGGDPTDARVRLVRPDGTTYDTITPEDDGSYTFEDVPPNTYTLQVIYPGSEPVSVGPVSVTVDAPSTVSAVTIPAPTPSTTPAPTELGDLSGQIVLTGGRDPRSATITLLSGTSVIATTNPDASGGYSFDDIPIGNYRVEISYSDTRPITLDVRIRQGRTTNVPIQTISTLTIPTSGRGHIAGLISFEGGNVSQVEIKLSNGSVTSTTRSDSDGNYNFMNLTVGRYEIIANHDLANSISTNVLVEANRTVSAADLDLTLLPATLNGKVRLLGTGDVEDVDVILTKGRSEVERVHPGADGLYVFSDIEPGTYQLRFSLTNFADAYQNNIVLMANQARVLSNVDMVANPGSAKGTVTIDGAGSLSDVEVRLRQSNTDLRRITPNTTTGMYTFGNLAPGTYMVAVHYNDIVTAASSAFSVTSNTITTVPQLSFSTNGSIQGTISLLRGNGKVRNASVKLQQGEMTVESTNPNRRGEYSFSRVQPGTYKIVVELSRYISAEKGLRVNMGISHTLDLELAFGQDDYGSEPGDTISLVLPRRSKTFKSVNGEIEVPDDEDWFTLPMKPRFSYLVTVAGNSLSDPELIVYDKDGETVVARQNNRSIDDRDPRLLITAPASDRRTVIYYLAIKGVHSESGRNIGTYTLNVKELTTRLNIDPTTNQASDRGVIEFTGDVKLYYIELNAGQSYVIHVEGLFNSQGTLPDPRFDLYNGDYTTRIDGNNDIDPYYSWFRNRNSRLVHRVPGSTGTVPYQIGVTGHYSPALYSGTGDGTGTFRIRVVLQDPSVWLGDDYAASTSTSGLLSFTDDTAAAEGTIERSGDADWFKVILTGGQNYSIDVKSKGDGNIDGLPDPAVQLRNASGGYLTGDRNSGANGRDASFAYNVPGSGQIKFYVHVYGEYGNRGAYEVIVANIEADVGHTASTALEVELVEQKHGRYGKEWQGRIDYRGDRDWYKVTLRKDQSYRIHIRGSATLDGTLRDPFARLFDASSNFLLSEDDGGIRLNVIIYRATGSSPETIYIEAGEYRQDNTGTYLVVVKETGEKPSEDVYTAAETLGFKKGVAKKRRRIDYSNDIDWFKVSLKPTRTYRFYFWPSWPEGDTPSLADESIALEEGFMNVFTTSPGTNLSGSLTGRLSKAALFYRTIPGSDTDPDAVHHVRINSRPHTAFLLDRAYVGRYTLAVNQVPGLDDYGSSTTEAGVLNLQNVPASGSIDGDLEIQNDTDWYRVQLRNGEEYTIQMFGNPVFPGASLRSPILVLRDNAGTEIVRSTTGAVAREIVFNVPGIFGETTYYIDAGGINDIVAGVGIYKVTVQESP